MRSKRRFTTFNLSFLDIMSCGFGAVILIFLILDHSSELSQRQKNSEELAEVTMLEEEILEGRELLAQARNTNDLLDERLVETQGRAERLISERNDLRQELSTRDRSTVARAAHVNQLKADIQSLEEQLRQLRAKATDSKGNRAQDIAGDGDRQYLTGLKLGGSHTLVLLDRSASMLDRRLVNIIRLRNMSAATQREAKKWAQARQTVRWLLAQLSPESYYQVYAFNTKVEPLLEGTRGQWLAVEDSAKMDKGVAHLQTLLPQDGTSLENAFAAIAGLSPLPDNIILITDGLPTQGAKKSGGKVNSRQRERHFAKALRRLPSGIPVNVILAPMEGDPHASAAFWRLAIETRGSFMTPSKDWP
jgi:hypothetical protein